MATTRIMPLHIGKGRTESRAISAIIEDKNSVLTKRVQALIDDKMEYHIYKSGWHVSQDRGNN